MAISVAIGAPANLGPGVGRRRADKGGGAYLASRRSSYQPGAAEGTVEVSRFLDQSEVPKAS